MYPRLKDSCRIHYYDDYGFLVDSNIVLKLNKVDLYIFNKIDGITTVEKLKENIARELGGEANQISNIINKFIESKKDYIIFLDYPQLFKFKYTGKKGFPLPLELSLEITNRCNLKCIHCYKNAGYKSNTYINYETLINTLNYFKEKITTVQLTGGDPMLHPQFSQILNFCKNNFDEVIVSIPAILVNKDNAKDFLGTQVNVSLYSINSKDHDNITLVSNSYFQVINGIKLLQDLNVDICVTNILTNNNIMDIEAFINEMINSKIKNIKFGLFSKVGRGIDLDNSWELGEEQYDYITKKINEMRSKYKNIVNIITFTDYKHDKIESECNCGRDLWTINEKGNIIPCAFFPDRLFTLGNIYENKIEDIIKKINLSNIRDNLIIWNEELKHNGSNLCKVCSDLKEIH